jgi:alkylhydroperoxidase family enzyme
MSPRIAPLAEPCDPDLAMKLEAMMPPGVPPLILFRTLARNPRVLEKIRLGNLLDRGSLARRDRELVILRTTARCGSEYEWGVHVDFFAQRVGLTQPEIAASVDSDPDDPVWSAKDRSTVRLVDELHETSKISDGLWDLLRHHWSEEQLVELVVLVGFYHTISFATNAFLLPLEEHAARFPLEPGGVAPERTSAPVVPGPDVG